MVLFGLATWCRLLRDGDVPSAQRNGPQSFGAIRAQEWSITTRLSAQCRFDCTLFAYQSRFRIFYLPSCGNKSGGAFDDHQHQSSHRIEDRHQWTRSPSRDLESHPRVHRNSSPNRKSSKEKIKAPLKSPVVLPFLPFWLVACRQS